jgi:hypothetical protein
MTNILKNYIRDQRNNPVGVVVVVKENENYRFGYSLCAPQDRFDKETGTKIAIYRAQAKELGIDQALAPLVPDRREVVLNGYLNLEKRASKYFKN